jgi:hypothetical protein
VVEGLLRQVTSFVFFRDEEITSLSLNLRRLSTLSQIQNRISEICDTSFLFWHRVIIPIHFGYIFDNDKKDANRLPVKLTSLQKGFLFQWRSFSLLFIFDDASLSQKDNNVLNDLKV